MALHELHHLLGNGPGDESLVARRGTQAVRFGEFRAEVAAWRQAFADAPGQRFALFFDDSLTCAAALYGAWHAGKIAYLPGDALPATVAHLRKEVDGFAGDFNAVPLLQPLLAAMPDWPPLNPAAEQLVIFTSGSTAAPSAIPKQLGQLFNEVRALHEGFRTRVGEADGFAVHELGFTLITHALAERAELQVCVTERRVDADALGVFVERLGDVAATLEHFGTCEVTLRQASHEADLGCR